jgi:hypothetical protein
VPEHAVATFLGVPPGWYAHEDACPAGSSALISYFRSVEPAGGVFQDGYVVKGWADSEGVIMVSFKEGKVAQVFFVPMLPRKGAFERLLELCVFDRCLLDY